MSDDHVAVNRMNWNADAPNWVERGRRSWSSDEPFWGTWGNPESEVGLLPDLAGLDAVELGCGTAYVSAWMARKGAHVVAMDVSEEQLATAGMFQRDFDLHFPTLQADGERLPFADATFDVAISEYGVALWCDPFRWVPEAARVLRTGGRLVFVTVGSFMMLCFPPDDDSAPADITLHRDYFGMHRFEWHDEQGIVDGVEFHLTHGDMLRLLRANGFEVEDLIEMQPPPGEPPFADPFVQLEWARRWPSVEAWKARKVGERRPVRTCSAAYTSAPADIDEEDDMGVKFLTEEWATASQDAMNADPGFVGAIGGQTARLQQVVTGVPDGDVHYYVKLEDGKAEVAIGDVENPDATISQDYDTAKGISTGELSAVAAYMSGKLRVQGNLMKLMTMQGVLTQLPNALKGLEVDY